MAPKATSKARGSKATAAAKQQAELRTLLARKTSSAELPADVDKWTGAQTNAQICKMKGLLAYKASEKCKKAPLQSKPRSSALLRLLLRSPGKIILTPILGSWLRSSCKLSQESL